MAAGAVNAPIEDCTAVVLAGGASSRMGQNKADVRLAGEPLLDRTIRLMRPVFTHVVVSVREPRSHPACPQIFDMAGGGGPMAGIVTALAQVPTPWIFAVACDMPFVSCELVRCMARQRNGWDALVPVVAGMPQPLAGFYARRALSVMKRQMARGEFSLQQLLHHVNSCLVPEHEVRALDPAMHSLIDLDTPEDVQRAEFILQMKGA